MRRPKRSYDEMNRLAAERILSAPELFGGLTGFPAVWSRMLLARLENERWAIRKPLYDAKQQPEGVGPMRGSHLKNPPQQVRLLHDSPTDGTFETDAIATPGAAR